MVERKEERKEGTGEKKNLLAPCGISDWKVGGELQVFATENNW